MHPPNRRTIVRNAIAGWMGATLACQRSSESLTGLYAQTPSAAPTPDVAPSTPTTTTRRDATVADKAQRRWRLPLPIRNDRKSLPATASGSDSIPEAASFDPTDLVDLFGQPMIAKWADYLATVQARVQDGNRAIEVRPGRRPARNQLPPALQRSGGRVKVLRTSNFQIFSFADAETTIDLCQQMEQTFSIWTQMFFPFWNAALAKPSAATMPRQHDVVIFANQRQYERTLQPDIEGVSQTTGFYHDRSHTTYSYPADQGQTLRHEIVHQLFRDATQQAPSSLIPGKRRDFWIVEGIAGYFESMRTAGRQAILGGWDCQRMNYGRYRILSGQPTIALGRLRSLDRRTAQQSDDLASFYSQSIVRTHQCMDGSPDARMWFYRELATAYDLIDRTKPKRDLPPPTDDLRSLVTVDDATISKMPPTPDCQSLCLTRCPVSDESLRGIESLNDLRWLDLSRIQGVRQTTLPKLTAKPNLLTQLSLDGCRIEGFDEESLVIWLSQLTGLTQVDLSWQPIGDRVMKALAKMPKLETAWLTGTKLTDQAMAELCRIRSLRQLDVQRTEISEVGVKQLKRVLRQTSVNPLQVR